MLRKFRVKINDKEYLVEMEELTAPGPHSQPGPASAPPEPTPAPAPTPNPNSPAASSPSEGEAITAPMPGNILDVKVKVGDAVAANQVVAILEAMKMENEIVAPRAGIITAIAVSKGNAIDVGKPIVFLK